MSSIDPAVYRAAAHPPAKGHAPAHPHGATPGHIPAKGHGDAQGQEEHNSFAHYSHYAHSVHLAAEAAEFLLHTLHHGYAQYLTAAVKLMKTHGQMAFDLRRTGNAIRTLENAAKQGGAVGAKAAQKLQGAKSAYNAALAEFNAERAAVNAAQDLVQHLKYAPEAAKGLSFRGRVSIGLAQQMRAFEGALGASRLGRGLLAAGRIAASKGMMRALVFAGSALEGISSCADSTAQTKAGKLVNGVLGAANGYLIMKNPLVAGVDAAIAYFAPKGYSLSEALHGSAGALASFGEAVFTHDFEGIDEFHNRSMQGHYGRLLQFAGESGEFWAAQLDERGFWGTAGEFVRAMYWWVSLDGVKPYKIVDRWPIGFK